MLRNDGKAHSGDRADGGRQEAAVRPAKAHRAVYSGIETIEAEESTRPLLVGERTKRDRVAAIQESGGRGKVEEASEIARRQVRGGAHIVDVCLQSTERDEKQDIPRFYEKLIRKVKAPVMIDTTDPTAIEAGADVLPGQGDSQFHQSGGWRREIRTVVPIAHEYGAAVVVGCIDEDKLQAQAFTRERKWRLHSVLTNC